MSDICAKLHEYRDWSDVLFRQRIENKELTYEVDDNYLFNPDMLVLYNFRDKPLLGEYKCGFIDCERGIILSHRNSQQVLDRFSRLELIGGLEFQREIDYRLNINTHHMVSLGQTAYMSIHGHRRRDTHWIGAHYFAGYAIKGKVAKFTTIMFGKQMLEFSFDCQKDFYNRIQDSITHNTHVYDVTLYYMEKTARWGIIDPSDECFLFRNLSTQLRLFPLETVQELARYLLNKRGKSYGDRFASEYGIEMFDHHLLYHLSTRQQHHF